MIMKALIGAALIAAIALIGYFYWKNNSDERKEFASSCDYIVKNGVPNETPSDKRLAKKRLQDCINFIDTGKLPE